MATYIQGQTDYISQIQPTEPNLAFDAQILQAKQTKYDANHKKVSDLYGSLLNSAMTRTDNIQARDEFFKIINDDIKKMGGLDFSLDQNVQAASSVFQSIYTNNNIVKDMVWTKNYNDEENRGASFKNCIDEEKCGGTYWEEGDRYMQYKRNEFKNASAEEALGMQDVRYIPAKNVMKASIKLAKDAGLNVEVDNVTGNYKVTTKNGELLRTPLTTLFSETLGKDPSYSDYFKAKAYVDRNDWSASKVNMGEFKDMNEANLGYLQNVDRQNRSKIDETLESINLDVDHLDQTVKDYEIDFKAGKFKKGSDRYNDYVQLVNLQNSANQAKQYTQQISQISKMKNNQMAIQTMSDHVDQQNAFQYFNDEINNAVQTLAFKDAKQTMDADEFAKLKVAHNYKTSEMALQHTYDIAEENLDYQNSVALEDHKRDMGHSSYTEGKSKYDATTNDTWIKEKEKAELSANTFDEQVAKLMKDEYGQLEAPDASLIATWKADKTGQYAGNLAKLKLATERIQKAHDLQLRKANLAAIKNGKTPIYRDVLTYSDLQTFDNELDYDYNAKWNENTYNNLKNDAAYSTMTEDQYYEALAKADPTKPLVDELQEKLKKILLKK